MEDARRIDARTLLVPMRAEGPDGIVGDGMVELTREDDAELYDTWAAWVDSA